jgi:hypothetical protein
MKRTVYHVVPVEDGDWGTKKEGNDRLTSRFQNKMDAINDGRDRAKKSGLGQLKIHSQKGQIQTEYTYGKDPAKYKG